MSCEDEPMAADEPMDSEVAPIDERMTELEDSVALLAELVRARTPGGQLHLSDDTRARAADLAPLFRRAERESADLEGGPVPAELLAAIAWTESSFRPEAVGPEVSFSEHRAYGLMQVWSGHFGNDLGTWSDGQSVRIGRGSWRDAWTNLQAGTLILLDTGWGRGVPLREVMRRYSGATRENTAAVNSYTDKVTNRYTVLRWGKPFGLSVPGL